MGALDRLAESDVPNRLADRDLALFSADAEVKALVGARLGWVDLAEQAHDLLAEVAVLARDAEDERVTDVVLLGMGGSSLAALVMSSVLPHPRRLHVLDTTSPVTVADRLTTLDPATTLWLVSSKSGGTIEPNSLYRIFRERADALLGGEDAGKRFIAVTDPGSSLERLAADEGFRGLVLAPPAVGGRFSALTAFGLVPAALCGIALEPLMPAARSMESAAASHAEGNPAAHLAAFIADNHELRRDKLTIVASAGLASFGLWVEQLVAESLGKHGVGVVPVVELASTPHGYGPDRAVVVARYAEDIRLADWARDTARRQPVLELVLDGPSALFGEFVRWEYAVAMVGHLLSINPFDEPNVAEAKAATEAVLAGGGDVPGPQEAVDDIELTFAGGLADPGHPERTVGAAVGHAIAALDAGDYLAVLAYLPDDDVLLEPLRRVVPPISNATGAAVCLELGPRYLHSTGQLHKGGPDNGVFVLITTRDMIDVPVPGRPWGLAALNRAQAEGDLATLAAHGRRVLRLDLPDASEESVRIAARALADGAGAVVEER